MKLLKCLILGCLLLALPQCLFAQRASDPAKPADTNELDKKITERAATIEITRLEAKDPLYSIELRNAGLNDFFRLLAHDYDINVLVDERIDGYVTASFTNISLEAALDNIAQMHSLLLEKNKGVIVVKPNLVTKAIVFQHIDAASFLSGAAVTSLGSQGASGAAGASAGATTAAATSTSGSTSGGVKGLSSVYNLLSDIGQILLGQQRNLIMVIDYPQNVEKIEEFAKAVDGSMNRQVFKLKYISSKQLVTEVSKEKKDWELESSTGSSSSSGSSSGSSQ